MEAESLESQFPDSKRTSMLLEILKKIIFPKLINLYLCVRKDYDMWGKKANVNMIQILIQSSFRMDLSKTKNCFAVNESK